MSWYAFTLAYTKAKWPYISPNHRRGIAEALTDVTDAMIIRRSAAPPVDERRAALRWSLSTRIRDDAEPPANLNQAFALVREHLPLCGRCWVRPT